MNNDLDFKKQIEANLHSFLSGDLRQNALQFLATLGYKSDKKITLQPNTPEGFKTFLKQYSVQLNNEKKAHLDQWQTVDFLFQLTDEEISQSKSLFNSSNVDVSDKRIQSYLFFAIRLKESEYRRSVLAEITREINRTFPMPVKILFQHSKTLTFSIIDRRLHKRDETKDVLQKVTLIKDIRLENPHRAHIEILKDLALQNYDVRNFVELHNAWQATLDTKELNKKFFQELANWYFWAVDNVKFPADEEKNKEVRNATSVIRLITRLMFVWFLKEKGLVSDKLFNEKEIKSILRFKDKSTFYKAILQNLFFATLNSEMGKREFRKKGFQGKSQHYGVHNVFRYESEFIKPQETIKELFEDIPFLNGGLFECLDKPELDIRVDGFSDRDDNVLQVPDKLFFGAKHSLDLNETYGTKNKKYEVQGLINLLNSYKFTVAENTPIEEEIALDPELLGKVFENLLASYNPETKTTARKQTGSFYTPREIVNYMVDESLIAYLKAKLQTETEGFSGFVEFGENQPTMFGNDARKQLAFETPVSNNRWHGKDEVLEKALCDLFSYTENENQFNELETEILIKAIDSCKILDPACGSGAFPMGILHRLVHLLGKLDKDNVKWKQWQKQKAIEETKKAYDIGDSKEREERLLEINDVFENNASDYGRKLFLIENCIYGVDIQPIAIQIAKLRFFISLIVDQRTNEEKKNLGILPLPNLETKFVAANTLIGLETNGGLKPTVVYELEDKLKEVRAKHFSARTRKIKEKCREEDKHIRAKIAEVLKQAGFPATSADQIANWNPYDQNKAAIWFDAEYMFGTEKGFDILIGNPPYGVKFNPQEKEYIRNVFKDVHIRTFESYNYFIRKFSAISKSGGVCILIIPSSFLSQIEFEKTRKLILEKYQLLIVLNLGDGVFEGVTAPTCVIAFSTEKIKSNQKISKLKYTDLSSIERQSLSSEIGQKSIQLETSEFLKNRSYNYTYTKHRSIIEKCYQNTPTLKDIAEDVATGISPGLADAFILDESQSRKLNFEREIVKKLVIGGEINRYILQPKSGKVIIYFSNKLDVNDFPNCLSYLKLYKEKLEKRVETKSGVISWFVMLRPRRQKLFEEPKILIRQTANRIIAAFDNRKWYCLKSGIIVQLPANSTIHYYYLLALFNSSLMYFLYRDLVNEDNRVFPEVKPIQLFKLPIRIATEAQQTKIAEIVDEIIKEKNQNPSTDTSMLERKIDGLVYRLYGLTHEEIQIVEGKDN